jgi:Uncharacterized conserved protein
MCTVSFITNNGYIYFTSNRDENRNRKAATMPQTEIRNGKKIIFPKDPAGGGTWFAVDENGTVGILLNGAFQKHIPIYPYRKSRGLILLDLMDAEDGSAHCQTTDLTNTEPFTIVFFQNKRLYELRWDGHQKYFQQLDNHSNYIWSSVTLYSAEIISKRKMLFEDFIANKSFINSQSIYDFHINDHGDHENGFVINRQNGIKTQCITQAIFQYDSIKLFHHDLLLNRRDEQTIKTRYEEICQGH